MNWDLRFCCHCNTELFDGNKGDAQILELRTFPGAWRELGDVKFARTNHCHDRPIRTFDDGSAAIGDRRTRVGTNEGFGHEVQSSASGFILTRPQRRSVC